MAYYKVRIEVWCDWDPVASELEEIVENIRTGDAGVKRTDAPKGTANISHPFPRSRERESGLWHC
jgi:hypothetical protein